MIDRFERHDRSRGRLITSVPLAIAVLLLLSGVAITRAQSPDEHEQHHPETPPAVTEAPATPPDQTAIPGIQITPAAQSGGTNSAMGQAMGGSQMCCGGAPAPSPLYASMMAMPELTPERREELGRQAIDRMAAGSAMMNEAFARLAAAAQNADAAAMQEANAQVREGHAQFESGLTLQHALDEGSAPRDIALGWFRKEMSLVPLSGSPPPHGFFGLSWFHYIVMILLGAFALSMIAMYFRKMRRADALVARLVAAPSGATAAGARAPAPLSSPTSAEPSSESPAAASPTALNPEIAPSKPNSWTGLLRVARIFDETASVKTFRLIDPLFGRLPFAYLPGQFLTVTATVNGESIKRSYTISSSPTDRDYCEITVKREEHGAVSRFLHEQVHEDDTLQITAPSGRFTFTGEESTSVVLIGGGVGVTPMMSAVRYLTKRSWPHDIYFVFAGRSKGDLIFREELEHLQRRYSNLHLTIVLDEVHPSEEGYIRGRITREVLESRIPDLPSRRVHICGPPPMMNAVKALLTEMGVPADRVRSEIFQGKEQPRSKLESVPATQAQVAVVSFAKSNRTAMLPPTKTVLEASEDVGVNIEFSCRIGTCGVCRTKLLSGSVTMEVEDGLEPGDKENGIILACQAKSTGDLAVDA